MVAWMSRGLLVAVVAVSASRDLAQDTLTQDLGPSPEVLSASDLRAMHDLLALTPEQETTVRELYAGARSALEVAARRAAHARGLSMHIAWSDTPEGREASATYHGAMDQYAARCEEVEREFLSDARDLLSAEQVERWPAFERARRRQLLARFPSESGFLRDLVRFVRDMELSAAERAATAPILERYETQMHPLLVKYFTLLRPLKSWQVRFGAADLERMSSDPAAAESLASQVRELQARTERMLIDALGPEHAPAFYNGIIIDHFTWRPYLMDDRVAELLRVRGLTLEQRRAIERAAHASDAEFRAFAEEWSKRQAETGGASTGRPGRPAQAISEKYGTIAVALLRRALDVLSPEQRQGYDDGTDPLNAMPPNGGGLSADLETDSPGWW